jgi:hypothetical protein
MVADACIVAFDSSFSKSIGGEDSYKFSNSDENLAINRNGTFLSIEGRPDINGNDTVPLSIWQYRQSDYYLSFKATNFPVQLSAILKDKFLNVDQSIDLYGTTVVNLTITSNAASAAADRFYIVFKPVAQCTVASWIGTVSSDWSNPDNWCPATVPLTNANVVIPANTPFTPALTSATTVNDLTLQGQLALLGQELTINGSISGNGSLSGSTTSKLIINGNAGLINFTAGAAVLYSLQVSLNAAATVDSSVVIVGK